MADSAPEPATVEQMQAAKEALIVEGLKRVRKPLATWTDEDDNVLYTIQGRINSLEARIAFLRQYGGGEDA